VFTILKPLIELFVEHYAFCRSWLGFNLQNVLQKFFNLYDTFIYKQTYCL